MRSSYRTSVMVLVALVAYSSITASCAAADEPLRWKFKLGEKLNYTTGQDMTIAITGVSTGPQNVTMHQEMEMNWEVIGVNEEGEAVIQQKFDRIKLKTTLPPPVGSFEYDTKSEKPQVGPAAMLAPMFKTLTEAQFELTMTSRGVIKDIKIPDAVISALKNSPAAATMGDLATPDGFRKVITRGSLVLPEKPAKPGETSSSKIELNSPGGGKQIVETAYRYEGTKLVDGVNYAVFRPSLKLTFEGVDQVKIAQQDSSGEALFNIAAGRLHSTTLTHKVVIDAGADPQKIQQTIEQKIDVKVTPVDEKKPHEANQPETTGKKGS